MTLGVLKMLNHIVMERIKITFDDSDGMSKKKVSKMVKVIAKNEKKILTKKPQPINREAAVLFLEISRINTVSIPNMLMTLKNARNAIANTNLP